MSSRIDPISTIIASFPFPELISNSESGQKPTYHSLLKIQNELNTNAASVDTTHGTGIHGYLVLTMTANEYLEMTNGVQHPEPVNPGQIAANATAAAARNHDNDTFHHKTYHNTDKALKKLILAACPDLFVSAIKQQRTGYANVTTLQLLNHLWTTYGIILPEDLDKNLITMATAWHPTTPIETLFLQIDDGIAFALAGDSPIDDSTAVRTIYKIIFDTGLFDLPCRDWRARPNIEKTLANFKIAFQAANNDRAATTSTAGYHTNLANATITQNDTLATLLEAHNKLQSTRNCQHKSSYMARLTSTEHQWHHPVHEYSSTPNQAFEKHGLPTAPTDGTSAQQWNTTGSTEFTNSKQKRNA